MFFKTRDGMRPAQLEHNPVNALVGPRPIAWVSTVGADGTPNLAPFSYFNAVSADPPFVMFAPNAKAAGAAKDSYANLLEVPEFVVSLVSCAQAQQMNATSKVYPLGVNEFERCGIESAPSHTVRPPRVASSHAAFECRVYQVIALPVGSDQRESHVVIGEVTGIHIDDAVIVDGQVSERLLDPLARLGAFNYGTLGDIFAIARPQ